MRILLLFLTFTFAGELEVEGDLKVTGTIENDSLQQIIDNLQEQINYLMGQIGASAYDCNGVLWGDAVVDNCGTCDNNPFNDCIGITDYDGNIYFAIGIGEQVWLQENLKVTHYNDGTPIPNLNNSYDWTMASQTDAPGYCVMEGVSSDEYGYLYKGSVANNESGVCPINFHIPTDDEWKELELFLGMPEDEIDLQNWSRGETVGGGLTLKSQVSNYWNGSGGNNLSGFSAIGGGYRSPTTGVFHYLHQSGYFWGISTDDTGIITYNNRELKWDEDGVARQANTTPNYGFSIRCVAD